MEDADPEEDFWLFGYGSLIWKPPPHYDRRIPGYVTGYVRRFWQASEDHRGTPSSPGRVVTLIPISYFTTPPASSSSPPPFDPHLPPPSSRVWGVAYRIIPSHVEEVKQYLDIREINGYSIDYADFCPAINHTAEPTEGKNTGTIRTLLYIGTPSNPQFTHPSPGPIDPQDLAAHIYTSLGPSGRNSEYLLELDDALASLHENHSSKNCGEHEVVDVHVRDLADRVRTLIQREQEEGHDTEVEEEMEQREEELEEEMERVLTKEEIEQVREEPEEWEK